MYIKGFSNCSAPLKDDFTLNDLYSSKQQNSPLKLEQVLNNLNSDKDTNDSENAFESIDGTNVL